tara:strand:+ start:1830 stop:3365 length:1536 start_codon:yes stop_codon:yes gene_type:complete
MTTQYIYLLQEREFIRTNDNVYKVGMTTKENYERFRQYPKGSVLLFQMICNNCKNIEKLVLKKFKETFKQRKDIGNEYFEGEYKGMIDIIYLTIKDENAENVCIIEQEEAENNRKDEKLSEDDKFTTYEEWIKYNNNRKDEADEELSEGHTEKYEITTYNEWIKYNNKISKVIITNKTREEGFIKLKDYLWIKLSDEEYLLGFIQNFQKEGILFKNKITNESITFEDYLKLENNDEKSNYYKSAIIEYNDEEILKDTLKKCYVKKYDLYNLNYHEYPLTESVSNSCVIFNSINTTFTPVDELISDKILTERNMGRLISFHTKNTINTSIVDDILKSLIPNHVMNEYNKLVYNLIVKQEEKQIIFYDYNECLLTTWIKDLLHKISNKNYYALSCDYYNDKKEFKKMLKANEYRCIIIYKDQPMRSVEDQINTFRNLGFINFIVCQKDKQNIMYNIANYRNYLNDNKELLIQCIKEENNYVIDNWESEIHYDDSIFYSRNLLLTNFLKWCCMK